MADQEKVAGIMFYGNMRLANINSKKLSRRKNEEGSKVNAPHVAGKGRRKMKMSMIMNEFIEERFHL